MSIIALLTGGIFGTLTALIALFGIGVDWSTGATVYFSTATLIALSMISMGTFHRLKTKSDPDIVDWKCELQGYQPGAFNTVSVLDDERQKRRDDSAA